LFAAPLRQSCSDELVRPTRPRNEARERAPTVRPGPCLPGQAVTPLRRLDHPAHAARSVVDADVLVAAGRRYREREAAGGRRGAGAGRGVGRQRAGVEEVGGVELLGGRAGGRLLRRRILGVLDRRLLIEEAGRVRRARVVEERHLVAVLDGGRDGGVGQDVGVGRRRPHLHRPGRRAVPVLRRRRGGGLELLEGLVALGQPLALLLVAPGGDGGRR